MPVPFFPSPSSSDTGRSTPEDMVFDGSKLPRPVSTLPVQSLIRPDLWFLLGGVRSTGKQVTHRPPQFFQTSAHHRPFVFKKSVRAI